MNIPMFRAWDKQYKKMGEVTMLLFLTDELDHSENNNEPKKFEHFELMQFTGLNDKNDKEIYEKDIVKCGYGIGVVEWMLGAFWVRWIDDKECQMELLGLNNKMRRQREDDEQFEVIGNIFEHPTLLQ